jgi:integrase
MHVESDLRIYLTWCTEHGLDALAVSRCQVELYVRWLQEIRRFRPSTVSRRLSVVATFYRTCVIDGIVDHSPAEHVRRPQVPAESPTLGLSHLQCEALLTAARQSVNRNDFALVAMLGLLGLRIFEATGSSIQDLGEEHGDRVLRVLGKGNRMTLVPLPPAVGRRRPELVGESCGCWSGPETVRPARRFRSSPTPGAIRSGSAGIWHAKAQTAAHAAQTGGCGCAEAQGLPVIALRANS